MLFMASTAAIVEPISKQCNRPRLSVADVLGPKSAVFLEDRFGALLQCDVLRTKRTDFRYRIDETTLLAPKGWDVPKVTFDKLARLTLMQASTHKKVDRIVRVSKDEAESSPSFPGLRRSLNRRHELIGGEIMRQPEAIEELGMLRHSRP